jgi:hypothetical protein
VDRKVCCIGHQTASFHELPSSRPNFDHLVGEQLHGVGDREAKDLRCLEVDHELELGGLQDRQVGRLLALEDAIDVAGSAPVRINSFWLSMP